MAKDINITIDVIGFIFMTILYISGVKKSRKYSFGQKLFNYLVFFVMIMFLIESITWALDGKMFENALVFLNVSNVLLFILGPINPLIWTLYVDYKAYQDTNRIKKRLLVYLIPIFINAILCIIQLFTPVLFGFDSNNNYYRLPLAYFTYAIPFGFIIYTVFFIIKNKIRIGKRNFKPLLFYAVIPFLGLLIQLLITYVSTMYISTAFSILIVYIKIQNDISVIDYLTGLNNRKSLEEYLKYECLHLHSGVLLYGIMVDVDNFKNINDTYGHIVGDKVLEDLSMIFKKSFRFSDFIARYAGDEFVIIVKAKTSLEFELVLSNLKKNTDEYNKSSHSLYKIKYTIGYEVYKEGQTIDEFLNMIDSKMYINKNKKKLLEKNEV